MRRRRMSAENPVWRQGLGEPASYQCGNLPNAVMSSTCPTDLMSQPVGPAKRSAGLGPPVAVACWLVTVRLVSITGTHRDAHASSVLASRVNSRMHFRIASGRFGQRSTTAARSASAAGFRASTAPDSAPPVSGSAVFPEEDVGCSHPVPATFSKSCRILTSKHDLSTPAGTADPASASTCTPVEVSSRGPGPLAGRGLTTVRSLLTRP